MKRFLPWLILFVVMLIAIPVLILMNYLGAARILGVIVVLGFSVAVRLWLLRSDKMKKKFGKVTFNSNDVFHLERVFPAWRSIPKAAKKELTRQMSKIIVGNVFDNYDHTSPSRDDITTVSLALTLVDSLDQGRIIVMHRNEMVQSQGQEKVVFVDISGLERLFVGCSQWPVTGEFLGFVEKEFQKI